MPLSGRKKYARKMKAPVITSQKRSNVPKRIMPVSKAVRSYVNRALGAHAENKTPAGFSSSGEVLQTMTATTWGSIINCSTIWNNLTQGTGQGNRIGNSIRPIYWNLKGYFNNNGSTAVNAIIKMYIIKAKNGYQPPPTFSTNPTDLYQFGNSTIAPTNSFIDLMRHINKDKWTVYATRTFKVGPALSASGQNNDFKTVCAYNVNLLKFQKHHIKYSDTGATQNSGLYAIFVIVDPLGGTSFSNNVEFAYDVEGKFEDA